MKAIKSDNTMQINKVSKMVIYNCTVQTCHSKTKIQWNSNSYKNRYDVEYDVMVI